MKTIILVAAGVVVAGATGVSWNAVRLTREAENARDGVEQKGALLDGEIRQMETRLTAATKAQANARSGREGPQPAKTAAASTAKPAPRTTAAVANPDWNEIWRKWDEEKKEIASRPSVQLGELAQFRKRAAMNFGPFFRATGLSPAQVEKFLDNSTARVEKIMDLNGIVDQGLVAKNDPTLAKLRKQNQSDYQTAQRELLGEAGYQQLQEYERAAVARNIVAGIAGMAVVSGVPFSTSQVEQLTRVIANASSKYQSGQSVTPNTIDWNIVDTQARSILSDAQWNAYTTLDGPPALTTRLSILLDNAHTKAVQADAASKAAQTAKTPGG